MYHIDDKVVLKRRHNSAKFRKGEGDVGTVVPVNKSAVLVQFGAFQNPIWCRYSEVRKYSDLDKMFDEFA